MYNTFCRFTYYKSKKNRKIGRNMKDYMNNNMNEYTLLNQFPLGMTYVPMQEFQKIYENLEKAFSCGTIFEELYKPFTGRRCVR